MFSRRNKICVTMLYIVSISTFDRLRRLMVSFSNAGLSLYGLSSAAKLKNSSKLTFRTDRIFSNESMDGFFLPRSTSPRKDTPMLAERARFSCVIPARFLYSRILAPTLSLIFSAIAITPIIFIRKPL